MTTKYFDEETIPVLMTDVRGLSAASVVLSEAMAWDTSEKANTRKIVKNDFITVALLTPLTCLYAHHQIWYVNWLGFSVCYRSCWSCGIDAYRNIALSCLFCYSVLCCKLKGGEEGETASPLVFWWTLRCYIVLRVCVSDSISREIINSQFVQSNRNLLISNECVE